MTKAQQHIINRYNKATACDLSQVYKSASVYKWRAQKSIFDEMEQCGGWGYRILGANSCTFSCAYLMTNKESGVVQIVYHTASNRKTFDYIPA